jgi:hypothetical protein
LQLQLQLPLLLFLSVIQSEAKDPDQPHPTPYVRKAFQRAVPNIGFLHPNKKPAIAAGSLSQKILNLK